MDPSQDRFDEAGPPRSGEGEIESSEASFDRIKVQGAGQFRQAAGTLRGKAEGNQTPREAGNFGAHELRRLHRGDGAEKNQKRRFEEGAAGGLHSSGRPFAGGRDSGATSETIRRRTA